MSHVSFWSLHALGKRVVLYPQLDIVDAVSAGTRRVVVTVDLFRMLDDKFFAPFGEQVSTVHPLRRTPSCPGGKHVDKDHNDNCAEEKRMPAEVEVP